MSYLNITQLLSGIKSPKITWKCPKSPKHRFTNPCLLTLKPPINDGKNPIINHQRSGLFRSTQARWSFDPGPCPELQHGKQQPPSHCHRAAPASYLDRSGNDEQSWCHLVSFTNWDFKKWLFHQQWGCFRRFLGVKNHLINIGNQWLWKHPVQEPTDSDICVYHL